MSENKSRTALSWCIWGVMTAFVLYQFLAQNCFGVLQKAIQKDLSLSTSSTSTLASLYSIAVGVMLIPAGLILDRINKRWVVSIAIAVMGIGYAVFATAANYPMAALGWILMGVGSAFSYISAAALIRIWFPVTRFAFILGLAGLVSSILGGAGGNILMPELLQDYTWRQILLGGAVIGGILFPLSILVVRDKSDPEENQEDQPSIIESLKKVFGCSQLIYSSIFEGILFGTVIGFAGLWGIQWQQNAWLVNLRHAAELNFAMLLGFGVGTPIIGFLSDYFQRRKIPAIIASSFAFLILSTILYYPSHIQYYILTPLLFLLGLCCGSTIIPFSLAVENTPARYQATAMSLVNTAGFLGGSLLTLVPGFFISSGGNPSKADLKIALSMYPIMLLVSTLIMIFLIRETYGKSVVSEDE